jgi:hypothetical protein
MYLRKIVRKLSQPARRSPKPSRGLALVYMAGRYGQRMSLFFFDNGKYSASAFLEEEEASVQTYYSSTHII